MTKLLASEEYDELIDVVDDPGLFVEDALRANRSVAVGYGKSLWRQIPKEHRLRERAIELTRQSMQDPVQHLEIIGRSFDKIRIVYEDVRSQAQVRLECDPGSVANFFETADSTQFQAFCKLLQLKLTSKDVFQRVAAIAAFTPKHKKGLSWLFRVKHGSEVDRITEPLSRSDTRTQLQAELDEIQTLIKDQKIDEALDKLYARIDTLLKAGNYSVVDSLFTFVNLNTAPADLILGLLISSLPIKRRLKLRAPFLSRAKQELEKRGEFDEGLFQGLD